MIVSDQTTTKGGGKIISYLQTTDKEFQKHFNPKKLSEICFGSEIRDPEKCFPGSRIQFTVR
jgi:hypothetical protein